jgi:hypothetical protein
MLPAAGQGAVNALQDAVILANCLYDLKDESQRSITDAFQSYYNQRYKHAKAHYESSKLYMKLIGGLTWTDRLARTIVLEYLPQSILQSDILENSKKRPTTSKMMRSLFDRLQSFVLVKLNKKIDIFSAHQYRDITYDARISQPSRHLSTGKKAKKNAYTYTRTHRSVGALTQLSTDFTCLAVAVNE